MTRSTAGCATCRRRKLKCDQKKPQCGQCLKASRVCEPRELTFRHHQNPSLNQQEDGSLSKYYSNKSSFDESSTWVTVPATVSFVSVSANASDDAEALVEGSPADDSAVPGQTDLGRDYESGPSVSPRVEESLEEQPPSSIDFILNPVSGRAHQLDTITYMAGSGSMEESLEHVPSYSFREIQKLQPVETDPEIAFLLRHYTEEPGKWLDLYFLDAYFEHDVPLKALTHPLLKYAACAYAAKHLDRTKNRTDMSSSSRNHPPVASTIAWPGFSSVDWAWYGAKYYADAIKLLRETLKEHDHHTSTQSPGTLSDISSPQAMHSPGVYARVSDETLAAMAILCNFEFMSASDVEWTRHLNGTLLVSDLRQTGLDFLMSSGSPSKARKAIFWNLFRQDVYAAYILEGRTRMNIDDIRMWTAAGLELDSQGLVLPSNGMREGAMKDDMISNALIWILSKVFNYIADVKDYESHQGREGGMTLATKEKWKRLGHELDIWFEGLPASFSPCARIERDQSLLATESGSPRPATVPDIWYTSEMCASTIQTYHLARILLLIHGPHTSGIQGVRTGAVLDFLNTYRSIEAELRYRAHEIFGIALSSRFASITLHQTQTIYVAAQYLARDDEREMAIDILRRVNSDLGWETEYRVQKLLEEWGWSGA